MITRSKKPPCFFPEEAVDVLRKAKLESYVQTLEAMDTLVDFTVTSSAIDAACQRADRKKGGHPPYPTEVLARMVFQQGIYNLLDEQCEHQVLDHLSFARLCGLDSVLNIQDACTLWNFRPRVESRELIVPAHLCKPSLTTNPLATDAITSCRRSSFGSTPAMLPSNIA